MWVSGDLDKQDCPDGVGYIGRSFLRGGYARGSCVHLSGHRPMKPGSKENEKLAIKWFNRRFFIVCYLGSLESPARPLLHLEDSLGVLFKLVKEPSFNALGCLVAEGNHGFVAVGSEVHGTVDPDVASE